MKLFTKDYRIRTATDWANAYFNSPDFFADIRSVEKFDHANVSPDQLVALFEEFQGRQIEIKCTYFGFFQKRVLGRTVGNGFAYVNSSSLGRQIWSIGATIVHEATHIVDEFFPKAYFGHGSNSPSGKGRTFPYFIDERAENWIKAQVLKKESEKLTVRKALLREAVL